MLKKLLQYGVPLIISIGLCYLLFTGIDLKEMVSTIRNECNFAWIGLALVISIFSHIFRAMRWGILLKALDINAPLSALVYSVFGTYAANLVVPRLGEIWRTTYIAHRQKASFTTVFGSMLADRLADAVMVSLLTIVTFIFASGAISQYLTQNTESYDRLLSFVSSPWPWVIIVTIITIIWWLFTKKRETRLIAKSIEIISGLWTGFTAITKMRGVAMDTSIFCYLGLLFLSIIRSILCFRTNCCNR